MSTDTVATLTKLTDFYQYRDELFEQDCDNDTLFASGYLRGFVSLVATSYGDESQTISKELIESVSEKIAQAKTELSPQDYAVVHNFWLNTQQKIAY